ncbi:uncharacterized protein LOC131843609 [Achroia grisella]|uniref:uncharacterized protein LOC131843609 n=1 Tax=Achroia grisella TaxID=688607 RepID=UPI0027D34D2B|nr:uncharacterized protein LOC131843609 [Achroia grisella]
MHLMGLDDSVGVEEIAAAIASAGDCQVQDVKVGDVRRNPTGAGACWVRAPIRAMKAITTAAKLKVGWVVVRAELLRQRQLRCFRCLEEGHVRAQCTKAECRSGLCYRCGESGHKVAAHARLRRGVRCVPLKIGRQTTGWERRTVPRPRVKVSANGQVPKPPAVRAGRAGWIPPNKGGSIQSDPRWRGAWASQIAARA